MLMGIHGDMTSPDLGSAGRNILQMCLSLRKCAYSCSHLPETVSTETGSREHMPPCTDMPSCTDNEHSYSSCLYDAQSLTSAHYAASFTIISVSELLREECTRLQEDASEFLEEAKLKDLVAKYSEFINFPIYLYSSKEVSMPQPKLRPLHWLR